MRPSSFSSPSPSCAAKGRLVYSNREKFFGTAETGETGDRVLDTESMRGELCGGENYRRLRLSSRFLLDFFFFLFSSLHDDDDDDDRRIVIGLVSRIPRSRVCVCSCVGRKDVRSYLWRAVRVSPEPTTAANN